MDHSKVSSQDEGVNLVAVQYKMDRATDTQDLSAGALSFTTSIGEKFQIHQVLVACRDGGGSLAALNDTTITVTFNSLDGASYDCPIGAVDFDGGSSAGLIAGDNLLGVVGEAGDEITVESSGSDNSNTLYVTVIYRKLS